RTFGDGDGLLTDRLHRIEKLPQFVVFLKFRDSGCHFGSEARECFVSGKNQSGIQQRPESNHADKNHYSQFHGPNLSTKRRGYQCAAVMVRISRGEGRRLATKGTARPAAATKM